MKKILTLALLVLAMVFVLASCDIPFLSEKETTATTPQETTPEETIPEVPDNPFVPSAGLAYDVNADEKTCTITGVGTCTDTDLRIGGSINGYKVTGIGDGAFYSCGSLTSVTIGDSVTSIGDSAFECCYSLTSVTIGDSVTSIGDSAFYECDSLTSVTIPDSVTSIGDYAFDWCRSLTSVTIGNSVTSIGYGAFRECTSLTSILVDNDNTAYQSIDGNLYSKGGNTLIAYAIGKIEKSFTIPESVTSIGDYAFAWCRSLTSVTIPDSVTSIGDWAFRECTSLTSVTIGESVTSISVSAFRYCTSLMSVTFANPNGWWYPNSADATSGTNISAESLADPATAAEYLKSYYYYWFRTE